MCLRNADSTVHIHMVQRVELTTLSHRERLKSVKKGIANPVTGRGGP
jgi:hypothetical protein